MRFSHFNRVLGTSWSSADSGLAGKLNEIGTGDGVRILEAKAMSVNALCPGGLVSGAHTPTWRRHLR